MNIDDIKRVKQAMTAVDGETAQNMLLGLLTEVYWKGVEDAEYLPGHGRAIKMFVEGTRNV